MVDDDNSAVTKGLIDVLDELVAGNDNCGIRVFEIGRCAWCLAITRVRRQAYAFCRKRFGEESGWLAAELRENPDFARKFYRRLTAGRQRAFETLFGRPVPDLKELPRP